jgi:CubicO group peptidase (beta-lactamase class C family)
MSDLDRRRFIRTGLLAGGAIVGLTSWAAVSGQSFEQTRKEPKMTSQKHETAVWINPQRGPSELSELGIDPAGFKALVAGFQQQLLDMRHPGAQLALYRNGAFVAELGGGLARRSPEKPVTRQTLFLLFSATKAWSATCAHILVERGRLDLDARIADYWPEFAQKGKGQVTVRQFLSHRGGFPALSADVPAGLTVAQAIEQTPLSWAPGEANGYHGTNFGETIAELIRRIDGRNIQTFLREEIFVRLNLADSYLGLPDDAELEGRVAYIYEMEKGTPGALFTFGFKGEPPVPEWKFVWNRPEIHRMVLPSGGGISTAHDLARFYGLLANGGELEGIRILKPETIGRATKRTNSPGEIDRFMRVPMAWSLGYMLGGPEVPLFGKTSNEKMFGHAGAACTVGWADPERRLGVAYLTSGNLSWINSFARVGELGDLALKACL